MVSEVQHIYEDGFAELYQACEETCEYNFDLSGKIVSYFNVNLITNQSDIPTPKSSGCSSVQTNIFRFKKVGRSFQQVIHYQVE